MHATDTILFSLLPSIMMKFCVNFLRKSGTYVRTDGRTNEENYDIDYLKAMSSAGKASLKTKKCECDGNVLPLSIIQVRASSKLIHAQCQSLKPPCNNPDTVQPRMYDSIFGKTL